MAAISDRFTPRALCPTDSGAVFFQAEMAAIHEHIGRDQDVGSVPDIQDRAIVADAELRPWAFDRSRCSRRRIQSIRPNSVVGSDSGTTRFPGQRSCFGVRPARNPRTACSVACSSSSAAWAIACSRAIGPGQIEKYASMPWSRTAPAPGRLSRRRPGPGNRAMRARRATPTAVLPKALWPSIAPSAVRHKSACLSRDSRLTALITSSMPGDSLPPPNATRPPPRPPAAPEPGRSLDRHAQVALDDRSEMSEILVERLDHLGRCPFLRAINGRRAIRATEWVGHVAGDGDFDAFELALAPGWVDLRQAAELASARFDFAAARVEQAKPECLPEARAAVVGGAAADAHDQVPGARGDRRQ